jgi:plasmid stabilization system protein ParE
VLTYLDNEWGHKVATDFLERSDQKIELIRTYPYIGIPSGIRDTRSLVKTKLNRLFYRISRNKIIILNLYYTRRKPVKRKTNSD